MRAITACSADGAYSVVLEQGPLSSVEQLCEASESTETGGILIGRYTPDRSTAIVSEATPAPPDSRRGGWWFVRGVAGLRALLSRRWKSRQRTHYIGEWHFHPVHVVEPSGDDIEQMARIARAKEYQCKEPILLILGKPGAGEGVRPVRMFVCPVNKPPSELLRRVAGDHYADE